MSYFILIFAKKKRMGYIDISEEEILQGKKILAEINNFRKGKIVPIDEVVGQIQERIVANILGFKMANDKKHGADAKWDNGSNEFLEIKNTTYTGEKRVSELTAVFNDTSEEKAIELGKTTIALAVWDGGIEPMLICYGKNKELGGFLLKEVKKQIEKSQRRTQNITLETLVKIYDFNIVYCGDLSDDDFRKLMKLGLFSWVRKKDYKSPFIEKAEIKTNWTMGFKYHNIAL